MYIYLGHGGSVRQRQVQAGGHHHQQVSLLQRDGHAHFFMTRYCCSMFILFKKDPPAFRFHAIFEPFTCYCAVRTISDFTSPSPL